MYPAYRFIILLLYAFFLNKEVANCQVFKEWGLKIGVAKTFPLADDEAGQRRVRSHIGMNYGAFIEWLDYPIFSLITEFDYAQKGYKLNIPYYSDELSVRNPRSIIETYAINNFSIIVAGKVHYSLSDFKLYGLAGPRADINYSRAISVQGPLTERGTAQVSEMLQPELNYHKNKQLGLTLGVGFQTNKLLPVGIGAEVRYNPDFTVTMISDYIAITTQSLEFLIVFAF